MWKILFKKIEKKKGKVCKKMPSCPTGQEFCPEYNDGIFAPKLADSIFSGQIKKWKILSKEKKNSVKFCLNVLLVPTGQEFRPECNFAVFAPKPTDRKFCGSKTKWKILLKEKKNSGKFCTKMPQVPTVRNFYRNATSPFFNKNLKIVYSEDSKTSGKCITIK